MCDGAEKLAGLPPYDALQAWLTDYVEFAMNKNAVARELVAALGKDSEFFASGKASLRTTASLLFTRAQDAGTIRRDIEPLEVLKLIGGMAHNSNSAPDETYRMLALVLDGLRVSR